MKIENASNISDNISLSDMMLIDNVLLKHHLWAIIASPKMGKSLVVLNMIASLLTNSKFAGRKVRQLNNVLYISGEGNYTLSLRINALKQQFNSDLSGLHIIRANSDFCVYDIKSYAKLLDLCNDKLEIDQLPELIVIDTIRSMSNGLSETNENFALLFAGAKLLQSQLDCSVGFVHHSLKNEVGKYAGGNNFEGSLDSLLVLNEGKLKLSKSKDLQDNMVISSYGINGWGDSAIVTFHDSHDDSQQSSADNPHLTRAIKVLVDNDGIMPSMIAFSREVFNPNATSISPNQKQLLFDAIRHYESGTKHAIIEGV